MKSTTYCCSSSPSSAKPRPARVCATHAPGGCCILLHALPVQPIREVERLLRRRQILRHPERDDVVVGLVRRGELHELDAARAPVAGRLDPHARPQLVARLAVLVAARSRGRAASGRSRAACCIANEVVSVCCGLTQRPPDPFAVAGRDQQAVGVVHFRAEVRRDAAGSRRRRTCWSAARCPSVATFARRNSACAHVHHGLVAGMNVELVRAA